MTHACSFPRAAVGDPRPAPAPPAISVTDSRDAFPHQNSTCTKYLLLKEAKEALETFNKNVN